MSGNGGGGNGDDDDKPLFELALERGNGPSMNDEMSQRPSLDVARQKELAQGHVNLTTLSQSLDQPLNDFLDDFDITNEHKQLLKEVLVDEAYTLGGSNAKITDLHYCEESGLIHAEINHFFDAFVSPSDVFAEHHSAVTQETLPQELTAIDMEQAVQQETKPIVDQEDLSLDAPFNDKGLPLTKEGLDTPKVGQADQTNQVDTATTNQGQQFETPKEIPEQDLTDHDRALQNELDQLRQGLVPTTEVSQERLEQEQELNSLMRDVAEVEKTVEREEILQSALQTAVDQNESNLLRQLELDILEQELINQLLAEQIADNYRYSHIDVNQLDINNTYGHYDANGDQIYGVEVDGQYYEVNLDEALSDNVQDTYTSATDSVEAMQERIAELQALQAQEQFNEEQIVERIQEIQAEQAARAESYYASVESQEAIATQNDEKVPSFENKTNDSTSHVNTMQGVGEKRAEDLQEWLTTLNTQQDQIAIELDQLSMFSLEKYSEDAQRMIKQTVVSTLINVFPDQDCKITSVGIKHENNTDHLAVEMANNTTLTLNTKELLERCAEVSQDNALQTPVQNIANSNDMLTNKEVYSLLSSIKGVSAFDAFTISNLEDKNLRSDLANIILKIDHITNEMTAKGERLEWTAVNNQYKAWVDSNIKDCGEQTATVTEEFSNNPYRFNYAWEAHEVLSHGHVWGLMMPQSADQPFLTYDARARSFGLNQRCDACSGVFKGLSTLIVGDKVPDPNSGAETPLSEFIKSHRNQ